jgi:prevent-host-death family protein
MIMPASEFKAKCLSLLDRVHNRGESITITKRGRVVARLVPATEDDERPWLRLREHGPAKWHGDPLAPLDEEWEADKKVDE